MHTLYIYISYINMYVVWCMRSAFEFKGRVFTWLYPNCCKGVFGPLRIGSIVKYSGPRTVMQNTVTIKRETRHGPKQWSATICTVAQGVSKRDTIAIVNNIYVHRRTAKTVSVAGFTDDRTIVLVNEKLRVGKFAFSRCRYRLL